MENTETGARMAELAAPPGGWPSLTSELVEVRFYLQQGLFDDAYELLSILQKRFPGHPQLTELARRPKPARKVDTGVLALVDSVLADSANLVARMPRRAAPRFAAPAQGGADRTDVHSVVAPEADTITRAPKRAKTGAQSPTRRSGAQPQVVAAPPRAASTGSPRAVRSPSGAQRTTIAAKPTTGSRPAVAAGRIDTGGSDAPAVRVHAPPVRENTRIYRTVEPAQVTRTPIAPPVRRAAAASEDTVISRAPQSGNTIVVDALQEPAPFAVPVPESATPQDRGGRKRRDAAAAEPPPAPAQTAAAEPQGAEPPEPRGRARFGQHVLNRLR